MIIILLTMGHMFPSVYIIYYLSIQSTFLNLSCKE